MLGFQGVTGNDRFGESLSLDGDQALITAPGRNENEGMVFAFRYNPDRGEWIPAGRLTPFDGFQGDEFGGSLALGMDEVWVGSPRAVGRVGAAYVFSGGIAGGWDKATRILDPTFSSGDEFASADLAAKGAVFVDELVEVTGCSKSTAYEAVKPDGKFTSHLEEIDGLMVWNH